MKSVLTIGGVHADPGTKKSGRLQVGSRPSSDYSIPLTIINGIEDGAIVTIISGQHGTQYQGIATSLELIRSIDPKSVRGAILVVPVVNVLGFEKRERLVFPLEDDFEGFKDLNSLWPGDSKGSLARRTIFKLFNEVVKRGGYLIELRGGDIRECLTPGIAMVVNIGNNDIDKETKTLAEASGFEYVLEMSPPPGQGRGRSGTEAPHAGIPTVVLEMGDQGKVDVKLLEKGVSSVMRILRHLKLLDGEVQLRKDYRKIVDLQQIRAGTAGVYIQLISTGSMLNTGDKIGEVISMDGSIEEVISPMTGLLIESFANPAVNSGEILAEVVKLK